MDPQRIPSVAPLTGSLVADRYRIEAVLGKGGMGAVYQVRDVSSGQAFALKRLRAKDDPKHVALFEREYQTLAGLKHPNIVATYDYGRDAEGPYYTMELLDGSEIHGHAPLPWKEVCRVLREVCSGLALLHARGLVHRDVSAKNVWSTPTGQIKLIDFGALSAFGNNREIIGTPPYVPPEALNGKVLDQRSDLYAVGVLGYWLLTGLYPYPARSLGELREIWTHLPRPASQRVRELERPDLPAPPAGLDELLAALLTLEPAGRPDSAGEVVARVGSIAGVEVVAQAHALEGHLHSKSFVGRERERRQLRKMLARTCAGGGGSVCVESEQGFGRSRFLAEAALDARLAGLSALETSAAASEGAYGFPLDIASKLLDAMPELAREAAKPFASKLGHMSPALHQRLGLLPREVATIPPAPGDARTQVLSALAGWLLAVSRRRPLALLVDDVQELDETAQGWLASLAHDAKTHALLLVSSLRAGRERAHTTGTTALRLAGRSLELPPLTQDQTRAAAEIDLRGGPEPGGPRGLSAALERG